MSIDSTLLKRPCNNFLLATNADELKLEGSYLYYDQNQEDWIRSGKCTGRGLEARHFEHLRAAKENTASVTRSKFYTYYPSKQCARSKNSTCKGVFEDLAQYVAIAWDPTSKDAVSFLTANVDSGGLWSFLEDEMRQIAVFSKLKKKKKTAKEIILEMTGYQFELGYDIAISDVTNISGSAGFEAFVGVSGS